MRLLRAVVARLFVRKSLRLGQPRHSFIDCATVRLVAMRHPSRFKLGQRFSKGVDELPRLSVVLCSLQAPPQELDGQVDFALVKHVKFFSPPSRASLLENTFGQTLGRKGQAVLR